MTCSFSFFSVAAGFVLTGLDLTLPVAAQTIYSQPYTFTTFAGTAGVGYADGVANAAQFDNPAGLAVDASGNIYVADLGNNIIRMITPAGTVGTIAGSPAVAGSANGTNNALFNTPDDVAVDGEGNLYVADTFNNMIRKITQSGTNWVTSTLAGSTNPGSLNSQGTNASFYFPESVAVDGAGNVFVADAGNNAIRKVTPAGVVTTVISSIPHLTNALGGYTSAFGPVGIAVDTNDNVYLADVRNQAIQKITPAGVVSTRNVLPASD